MAEALRCFRHREFFEAHEHWEDVWRLAQEPEKTFLQALIQIAAAFLHLERKNRVGAASLLRAALKRLDPYPAQFGGVAVDALRESLRAWLTALDGTDEAPALPLPEIR